MNFHFNKIIFLVLISPSISASSNYLQNLTLSTGIVNISLAESESNLESTDDDTDVDTTTEVEDVTPLSLISLELTYDFKHYVNKSVFIKSIIPLISSDGSGYYMGAIGMNYYFNGLSTIFNFKDEGTNLLITPTTVYYAGGYLGGGYLVYNTTSAKKTDLALDMSGQAGLKYTVGNGWSIKAELGAGRITGVNSSGFGIKAFFGGTYFLP